MTSNKKKHSSRSLHATVECITVVYLQRIWLCKVHGDGKHERNKNIKDLSGDVTQWQVADKHFSGLR